MFDASKAPSNRFDGGATQVIDTSQLPATSLSALIVDLEPRALREVHWHPHGDKIQYYLTEEARTTVFDATRNARTFNYRAGEVGCVPEVARSLYRKHRQRAAAGDQVFNTPRYSRISVNQWMALTPPDIVRGTLNLDDRVMRALRRERCPVVR